MKLIIAILAVLALTACGTMQGTVAGIKSDVAVAVAPTTPELEGLAGINAKLDNAIAISTAGNDPQAVACEVAGRAWVNSLPLPQADAVLPPAIGLSGDIATARVKVRAIDSRVAVVRAALAAGFPDSVTGPCAVIVEDAKLLAAKIAAFLAITIK